MLVNECHILVINLFCTENLRRWLEAAIQACSSSFVTVLFLFSAWLRRCRGHEKSHQFCETPLTSFTEERCSLHIEQEVGEELTIFTTLISVGSERTRAVCTWKSECCTTSSYWRNNSAMLTSHFVVLRHNIAVRRHVDSGIQFTTRNCIWITTNQDPSTTLFTNPEPKYEPANEMERRVHWYQGYATKRKPEIENPYACATRNISWGAPSHIRDRTGRLKHIKHKESQRMLKSAGAYISTSKSKLAFEPILPKNQEMAGLQKARLSANWTYHCPFSASTVVLKLHCPTSNPRRTAYQGRYVCSSQVE